MGPAQWLMILIGITGGVGTGKTTFSGFLTEWEIPIADTDMIARQLVEPGEPALKEIQALFGRAIIDSTGRLRRKELARIVFADEQRRRQIESILHPRIRETWQGMVEAWRASQTPMGAVVIPLLFETGAHEHFDFVICVACSRNVQESRLQNRGWSSEEVQQRIRAQRPLDEKMERSDYVVWTDGSKETHREQVARILERMQRGRRLPEKR